MKRYNICAVFLAVVIFVAFAISMPMIASASERSSEASVRISDKYNRLSTSDELKINNAIKEAEQSVDAIFLVAVYDFDKTIPSGENIVRSFGLDSDFNNIVLLVIKYNVSFENLGNHTLEINKHYYEMFTYGTPHKMISDYEANKILDNEDVYNNLKYGNFSDGTVAFIRESVKAMQGGGSHGSGDVYWYIIIIGVVVVSIIIIFGVKSGKKNIINNKNIGKSGVKSGKKQKNFTSSSVTKYGSASGSIGGFRGGTGGSRGGR